MAVSFKCLANTLLWFIDIPYGEWQRNTVAFVVSEDVEAGFWKQIINGQIKAWENIVDSKKPIIFPEVEKPDRNLK